MSVGGQLTRPDEKVARQWPALFRDSLRSRAWTIVFFQGFALICLVVGLATNNQAVLGATGAALGGTFGMGIRLLRTPPGGE